MSEQMKKRSEVCFVLGNVTRNVKKVSEICQVSKSTVYRVKKKLKDSGQVTRKPGSGRKRKVNIDDRR